MVSGEEQKELLEYISDDSDEDEEALTAKLEAFEPLLQMDDRFPDTVIMVGVPLVGFIDIMGFRISCMVHTCSLPAAATQLTHASHYLEPMF